MTKSHYDVIIVGAGLAAARQHCSTPVVACMLLSSRRSAPSDYKKICTHYLQPKTIPLLKSLELYDEVMEAGATFSQIVLKTPWGDVPAPRYGSDTHGLNIRRERLDPIFHKAAMAESGVDWWGGYSVSALLWEGESASMASRSGLTRGQPGILGPPGDRR